jgi:hypothetical protein
MVGADKWRLNEGAFLNGRIKSMSVRGETDVTSNMNARKKLLVQTGREKLVSLTV